MEVAVFINGKNLFISEIKAHIGSFAGLEVLKLDALFGLNADSLDEMLGEHGVVNRADIYIQYSVSKLYGGDMLFAAGFNGVGNKLFHLLPAADEGNSGVFNYAYLIAAVTADKEFSFHFKSPFRIIWL